jgi:outer membrane protein TolC
MKNYVICALAGAGALYTTNAAAIQPLSEFVASAKTANFDVRDATLQAAQKTEEAAAQGRKLLPVFTARGIYTHNQYEAVARSAQGEAVIVPQNQLDAYLSLDVPIIDVATWHRNGASNRLRDAAQARAEATALDAEQQVTRAYFDVLATRATLALAEKNLQTSESSRDITSKRQAAGLATELDSARATAEVARNTQAATAARYNASVRERQLATLSGLTPEASGQLTPDDLHPELPLATYLRQTGEETPTLRAARLDAEAADKQAAAQWYVLAPSLAANATERFTNATGFAGRSASYQLSATLTWRLDASSVAQAEAQSLAKASAEVRKAKAERTQADAVRDAYELVNAQIANCRAARAESDANATALKLATDKYAAGTALQLDVLQASRQHFASEVTRLQADADVAYARAVLRIVSGRREQSNKAAP